MPDILWSVRDALTCHRHACGAFVIESMSVLMDQTTRERVSNELAQCPGTAAVLCELAVQWQHISARIQQVEADGSSPTSSGLRLKDGQHRYPKNWAGTTPRQSPVDPMFAWCFPSERDMNIDTRFVLVLTSHMMPSATAVTQHVSTTIFLFRPCFMAHANLSTCGREATTLTTSTAAWSCAVSF